MKIKDGARKAYRRRHSMRSRRQILLRSQQESGIALELSGLVCKGNQLAEIKAVRVESVMLNKNIHTSKGDRGCSANAGNLPRR